MSNSGGGGAATAALSTKTANYAMTAADGVIVGNGTNITITLPSSVAVGATGKPFTVKNQHATPLTLAAAAGTIDGAASRSLAQYDAISVVSDGANWNVI